MVQLGLPVPPGFIITTQACRQYLDEGDVFLEELWEQVEQALKCLEHIANRQFDDTKAPLIVSVRSGAEVSMPGILETILNIGINDKVLESLRQDNGAQFALDSYLRLLRMFGSVVLGIEESKFKEVERDSSFSGVLRFIHRVDSKKLDHMLSEYKGLVEQHQGAPFPQEPVTQLRQAILGVFNSWQSPRAISYRQAYGIPDDLGTAVTVQMMVFGNRDAKSAAGVALTRDTATGNTQVTGEYIRQAQGEDLVAGKRTPRPISELEYELPGAYHQLLESSRKLEQHFKHVQDIEFTIEAAKLWLLQTRNVPLDPEASVKIAVRMVKEGLIDKEEALARVHPVQLEWLSRNRLAEGTEESAIDEGLLIAKGISACSGVAIGSAAFTVEEAIQRADSGEDVILVRPQIGPDDVPGMLKSAGIATARGGATSHAALIAKNMRKPCVVGCETIQIDEVSETFVAPGGPVRSGHALTVSGDTGRVFRGRLPTEKAKSFPELRKFRSWYGKTRPFSGAWSRAAYSQQVDHERDCLAEARELASRLPWSTEKANVIEALKLLHPKMRIRQEVAKAHDVQTIRRQMYDVIQSGYWNGPRTCYYPSALGKAGWQMAIDTLEEVDKFLSNPNYKNEDSRSEAGGYPRWIQDPNLREIITVYDPPRLGVEEFEDEHFVFTISCRKRPDQVLIEMNIGTAQLRSIESADPWRLIHITMDLDPDRYHNKGRRRMVFGGQYLQSSVIQQITDLLSETKSPHDVREGYADLFRGFEAPKSLRNRICSAVADEVALSPSTTTPKHIASAITKAMREGKIPLSSYETFVKPVPLRIAQQVMSTVFDKWWEKPFELPFVMQALEEVFQLQTLEIQGHFNPNGEVDYMLVYDAKGREESIVAGSFNPQSSP
jgi:phosphohistidine swiveling domain-containing protein